VSDFGCRESTSDFSLERDDRPSGLFEERREGVLHVRPGKSYSKRSGYIQELRVLWRSATELAFEDLIAPSKESLVASEKFVNYLPEGCLNLEIAISHSGEINFFFGDKADPFQVLIDQTGLVSFYGEVNGEEISGSDLDPSQFPSLRLLGFLDRKK
jgi:hypothetical protein